MIVEFIARHLRRFQLVVKDTTTCLFRVCLETGLSDAERQAALAEIRVKAAELFAAKHMTNVTILVEEVEELLADPITGKFRLVVPAGPAPA